MGEVRGVRWLQTVGVIVWEVVMHALSQGVEAVQQVHAVKLRQVRVVAHVPARRRLDGCGRVPTQLDQLLARDSEESKVRYAIPLGVDGSAWVLPEDGLVGGDVGRKRLGAGPAGVDRVDRRCWMTLDIRRRERIYL